MSEQPRKHGRSPRTLKQTSFYPTIEFVQRATYIIIITMTSHHITPTIGSSKFQFANIISCYSTALAKELRASVPETG